ncbi:protein phosphatase [Plasmopara halstedii]|uniref:Protein phosphatase n=1 Tax=Plasmopara halstedii TaxID=4781 RepID=A0A0P1B7N3_PLAHL|nr:protein phosphatase [Plasmopara halstedii]CEG50370.1 protein phosphatase [Plasmopara halstedii]|eukprot:XP_024586739.1 protein phosphatase [Plasmopara halstedii]
MGCILTKVCQDEDPLMLGDPDLYNCEQNEITTLPSSRVLSLDSSGVSERHQVTPVYKTTELGSDTDSLSLLVYGGGVPGVALETDGADSPELTGTRDGGYKSRNGRLQWGLPLSVGATASLGPGECIAGGNHGALGPIRNGGCCTPCSEPVAGSTSG